ncbi:MAG: ribosome silencing factor [Myxococcales bacterium]|nr:ribosome silencing factor [Myxococcales bacterium]
MEFIDKARQIANLALEKNAVDPVIMHVSNLCSYTDAIVICHGRSTRQVQAIVSHLTAEMKKRGEYAFIVEGEKEGLWALADYGDVIVHVFHEPMRSYYDLEGIWPDAPSIDIKA